MKTKTIWIWATIFGLLMSGILYMTLLSNQKAAQASLQANAAAKAEEAKSDEKEAEEKKEEEKPVSALKVSQGKRAISITVSEEQGVSGFLIPGSYVDVVAMIPQPEGQSPSARILLENKKVLAVGQVVEVATPETAKSDPNQPQPKPNDKKNENKTLAYHTVTLEVLPIEGASGILTDHNGELALMLRAPEDTTLSPQTHVTLEQLNKGEMPK
jgi:pilus assembly protein CpaB